MPNKISGLSGSPTASIDAGRPAEKARDAVTGGSSGQTQAQPAAAAGDVHITDSASQLASLEQSVRSLPAVDPARVTQFRTAIEQGTYTVRPQHVADQLLQLEQSLRPLQQEG
ncbi:MAG TPA: flagellar biosynthesis anti-sigma factor FlgM [Steroidobacteraceae bacterium]|nr:flagellar biosynthesis anti-sigma factor FlgM [Steroidobacteraceae bacterium]